MPASSAGKSVLASGALYEYTYMLHCSLFAPPATPQPTAPDKPRETPPSQSRSRPGSEACSERTRKREPNAMRATRHDNESLRNVQYGLTQCTKGTSSGGPGPFPATWIMAAASNAPGLLLRIPYWPWHSVTVWHESSAVQEIRLFDSLTESAGRAGRRRVSGTQPWP